MSPPARPGPESPEPFLTIDFGQAPTDVLRGLLRGMSFRLAVFVLVGFLAWSLPSTGLLFGILRPLAFVAVLFLGLVHLFQVNGIVAELNAREAELKRRQGLRDEALRAEERRQILGDGPRS
jgi:hypothetical protein